MIVIDLLTCFVERLYVKLSLNLVGCGATADPCSRLREKARLCLLF
jgi:hypothetical protein